MQKLFLIAQNVYLNDKKIKRNASIVVGFTKQTGTGGALIIHVAASYARGKELAKGLSDEHKSDFTVFDFTKYPDMKHGSFQYRDSAGS